MTSVTILGNGSMGQAIAAIAAKSATTVQMLGSADADVAVTGDIVVLAVPHPAVAGILAARGAQLEGKVVVDITNPVNFETFDSLVVAADSSKAAEIAAALPGASVVKAFNTNFAATLATGVVGSNPTTVLVAGDDAAAKAAVIELVTGAGLSSIDAGALSRARELESIGFLQITLAAAEKIGWTAGFAVVA
jgi:predicted dinucleotide-binding enzyme